MSSINFINDTPQGPKHTKTQTWITPPEIIEKLGGKDVFYLDPCGFKTPEGKILVETAQNYYFESDNGLNKEWQGNIWLNPPYNTRDEWLGKIAKHGQGIVLIFVRSETRSFQKYVKNATGINLMAKRQRFIMENGNRQGGANAPSCLIAFGEENYQKIKNIPGICCRIDKE